ncbi:hypothetical protein, partial [Methylobacillus sp.]|uniref:hypothetical protein n=1 Tax=Methylobacillus sp. TaxID=56818 RepID=UPI002FE2B9AE
MATVPQGQSQVVSLGPNDAIKVSTPGEAYVDHLSGTPESPYASTRLVNTTSPKVFGPYGANAQLRVRAIELSALYDGYTYPQPPDGNYVTGEPYDLFLQSGKTASEYVSAIQSAVDANRNLRILTLPGVVINVNTQILVPSNTTIIIGKDV